MHPITNTDQAALWDGPVGAHWASAAERYDAMMAGFDAALFDAAAIRRGDRVLDIGCGTGHTTRVAAGHASGGHVTGIDLSRAMLARARSTADRQGMANVSFVRGDAQVHPFPTGRFDVAISRGGVMFFADVIAAFTAIGRATRAGGRLAFVCPQPAAPDGESARAFAPLNALKLAYGGSSSGPSGSEAPRGSDDPDRSGAPVAFGASHTRDGAGGAGGGSSRSNESNESHQSHQSLQSHESVGAGADLAEAMASLSDPAEIDRVLGAAGYHDVTTVPVEAPMVWGADAADAADFILASGPVRLDTSVLDPDTLARVRAEAGALMKPYETDAGVVVTGAVWLVTAVRPPE